MPITRGAKKALRASARKKAVNDRAKKTYKEAIKKLEKLIKNKKEGETKKFLPQVYKAIDKAAKMGVLEKNTAARKKSRVSKLAK